MCARRCACGVRCGVRPSRGRCWLQAPLIGPPSMLPPLSKCAHVQGSVSKCAHVQGSVREKTAELTPSPILSLCWRKMHEARGVDCRYACSSVRQRKLQLKSRDLVRHSCCPVSFLLLSCVVPNKLSPTLTLTGLGQVKRLTAFFHVVITNGTWRHTWRHMCACGGTRGGARGGSNTLRGVRRRGGGNTWRRVTARGAFRERNSRIAA